MTGNPLSGGQGTVYPALMAGTQVALKIFDQGGDDKRIDRELSILSTFGHPDVVKVLSHGNVEADGQSMRYVVYEWVEGTDLMTRLLGGEKFLQKDLENFGNNMINLLDVLHDQGIYHRDVKPQNVVADPNLEKFKLIDFGLAKSKSSSTITLAGHYVGTPGFVAPEVMTIGGIHTVFSERYSLGVSMWLLATGQNPNTCRVAPAALLDSSRPDLDKGFRERIIRLLNLTPFERKWYV